VTDTDEARRRRSEAARKGAATKGPEARRAAVLKAAVTMGPERRKEAALKGAANRDPEHHREAIRKALAAKVRRTGRRPPASPPRPAGATARGRVSVPARPVYGRA
jgi:hypothetical protein